MYVNTQWKYGAITETERVTPEVGNRFLKIISADCNEDDPENPFYVIGCQDLQNGATILNRYYLTSVSKAGNRFPNKYTRETLLSLAQALAGPNADFIPNPNDIVGGIVIGAVEAESYVKKDSTSGVAYRIKAFFAAPEDWVVDFSDIADRQYYEGCEDVVIQNEGDAPEEAPSDTGEDD